MEHLIVIGGAALGFFQQFPHLVEDGGGKEPLLLGLELHRRDWHELPL
jgi:hypothetical protein